MILLALLFLLVWKPCCYYISYLFASNVKWMYNSMSLNKKNTFPYFFKWNFFCFDFLFYILERHTAGIFAELIGRKIYSTIPTLVWSCPHGRKFRFKENSRDQYLILTTRLTRVLLIYVRNHVEKHLID